MKAPEVYKMRVQRRDGQYTTLAICYGMDNSDDTIIGLHIWSVLDEKVLIHLLNQMPSCALYDLWDREVFNFKADFLGLATVDKPNPIPDLKGTWTTAIWQLPAATMAAQGVH